MKRTPLVLAMLLLASACGELVEKSIPASKPTLRNPSAPIWSIAQVDNSRLAGEWQQAAGFGAGSCQRGGLSIGRSAGQMTAQGAICQNGERVAISGPFQPTGPGRFRVAGQDWWVIWVDTDYRTVAVGTPDGRFGFLLNRGGALPNDRLRAAAEVFDFNGYKRENLVRY